MAPIPSLFSFTNDALKAVAYSIVTPPSSMASILIFGFKKPSLLADQITSMTLASAIWSDKIILNANA